MKLIVVALLSVAATVYAVGGGDYKGAYFVGIMKENLPKYAKDIDYFHAARQNCFGDDCAKLERLEASIKSYNGLIDELIMRTLKWRACVINHEHDWEKLYECRDSLGKDYYGYRQY